MDFLNDKHRLLWTIPLAAILLFARTSGLTGEPHIERIELLSTNQVTIHFNTEANRSYTLQYADALPPATNTRVGVFRQAPASGWSNLTVIPAIPFPNHYVLVAERTNRDRFFRLLVSP